MSAKPNPDASVILMGMGSRRVSPLPCRGTYRVLWSAWGPAAEFPPCTHLPNCWQSIPLKRGHRADMGRLAKFAHVPATGGSEERLLPTRRNYYVDVNPSAAGRSRSARLDTPAERTHHVVQLAANTPPDTATSMRTSVVRRAKRLPGIAVVRWKLLPRCRMHSLPLARIARAPGIRPCPCH